MEERRKVVDSREQLAQLPTRAAVLRDIAEEIRQKFPLEALMIDNMADGMCSDRTIFERRRA